MAATLRVPFATLGHESGSWSAALADLRQRGFGLVAMTPREPATDLEHFARQMKHSRLAMLFGTEGEGVSREAETAADYHVRIPIVDGVDSLNLAVASGIVLYRLRAPSAG